MSDRLEWRNEHAVLLREPQWAGIAQRENYKIRADLRPLFEAHPDGADLLVALGERRLHREGCEFLARMMHRRAAVWWGYCCLLTLFAERAAVREGTAPTQPDELREMAEKLSRQTGIKFPAAGMSENVDDFCKAPQVDYQAMLADYVPPPQDKSALMAAAQAVAAKADAIDALLPPSVLADFEASRASVIAGFEAAFGTTPAAAFDAANAAAQAGFVTYRVERAESPHLKDVLALPDKLETMRQGTVAQIKGAFPEKYPTTPEAAKLLKAEADRVSDEAVQAVWRWIVAPDERNTTLALAAGNAAGGLPEGMLAYTAAWSFGDLTPEGKQVIPVPPELPGTGLNSTFLMLALAEGGHRKMAERYELYFNLGLEVVYGKNLWPEAVMEDLSPHEQLAVENPTAGLGPAPEENAPSYRKWTK